MRLCRLRLHRPGAEMIWNDGYHFTRCAHCGAELVRVAGRWWQTPHGHVVTWKPRTAFDVFAERTANPDRRLARRRLPPRYGPRPRSGRRVYGPSG